MTHEPVRNAIPAGLRRNATWALAALALGLVCTALFLVGGPETARAERRDDVRINMIRDMAQCLNELPQDAKDALPAEAAQGMDCAPNDRWKDPQTGEPYRLEKRGSGGVAVCARFELPDRLGYAYAGRLDRKTGCFMAN